MASLKKYIKPQIKQKKIKLSYFLSNIIWVDQFNLVGKVYAQSSDAGGGGTSGGCGGCGFGGNCFGSDSCLSCGGCTGGSGGDPTGNCYACFLPGTKILMSDKSLKNIEDIRPGDKVFSFDLIQKKLVESGVSDLLIHKREGGYLILNNKLKVTSDHPLFVNGAWKDADTLQIGDALINSDGELTKVENIEKTDGTNIVYNLNLEIGQKNYFAENILAKVYNFD